MTRQSMGIRLRPIFLLAIVLLVISLAAVIGTVFITRAQQTSYACLRYDSDDENADWLLDLNTNLILPDRRPIALQSTQAADEWARSLDTQSVVYLRTDRGTAVAQYRLMIKPLHSGLVSYANDEDATTIETGITRLFGVYWSPDSQRIAYTWRDIQNKTYLAIARRDGTGKVVQSIGTPRGGEVALYGWAPDGSYVATGTDEGIAWVISYWAERDGRLTSTRFPLFAMLHFVDQVIWSPTSRQLAYLRTDQMVSLRLVVASLPVPGQNTQGSEISLNLPISTINWLVWSPDGKYLSMRYAERGSLDWQLVIFRVEAKQIVKVTELTQGDRALRPQGSMWSADSQRLIFWRERTDVRDGRDLVAYDIASGKVSSIQDDVMIPPKAGDPLTEGDLQRTQRRVIIARAKNGTQTGYLLDLNTLERIPLFTSARSVSTIQWSPDHRNAIIFWVGGMGYDMSAKITWVQLATGQVRTLESQNAEVEQIKWMADGKSILFSARHPGSLSVEALNLETNARTSYAGSLNEVSDLDQDPATGQVSFWWRLPDGSGGTDAYTADGKRIYRYTISSGQIANGSVYPSPDGSKAVILSSDTRGLRSVELATVDGQSRVLLSTLANLQAPSWSSDSSRVALNYMENTAGQFRIEVFDAQGKSIKMVASINRFVQVLLWTRCD